MGSHGPSVKRPTKGFRAKSGLLERLRSYHGGVKIVRCGFLGENFWEKTFWEETRKTSSASVTPAGETALVGGCAQSNRGGDDHLISDRSRGMFLCFLQPFGGHLFGLELLLDRHCLPNPLAGL
jgi:hypothetical protein